MAMDLMMGHFQVLFSGQVVEGANEATVRHNLSRRLALDERKVAQLFSGRTVVIRSDLTRDAADKLQADLAALGAVARIKDVAPDDKAKFKIDRKPSDQTLNDITAAHVECPRCGHLQLESEFCARCGIDMATAQKNKRKEDLLIQKKIREFKDGKAPAVPSTAPTQERLESIQPIKRRVPGHRYASPRHDGVRGSNDRPTPPGVNDGSASNPFGTSSGGSFWRKLLNPSEGRALNTAGSHGANPCPFPVFRPAFARDAAIGVFDSGAGSLAPKAERALRTNTSFIR
jgi:hypothetical protein